MPQAATLVPGEVQYSSEGADDTDEVINELRKKRGDFFEEPKSVAPETKPEEAAPVETKAEEVKTEEVKAEEAKTEVVEEEPAKTEEVKTEAAKVEETKPDDPGPRVPKHRYDSVKSRLDSALDKLAKYESGEIQAPKQEAKQPTLQDHIGAIDKRLSELDTAIFKASADGAAEAYAKAREEERKLLSARTDLIAQARVSTVTHAYDDQQRYDRTLTTLEQSFPVINPDHDAYDEKLVGKMGELVSAFAKAGFSESQALVKAAEMLEPQLQASVKPKAEAKPEATEAQKAAVVAKTSERKEQAVQKAVAASNAQPATIGKAGLDSTKKGQGAGAVIPSQLTDEEYDALPESKRRELRGDFHAAN